MIVRGAVSWHRYYALKGFLLLCVGVVLGTLALWVLVQVVALCQLVWRLRLSRTSSSASRTEDSQDTNSRDL